MRHHTASASSVPLSFHAEQRARARGIANEELDLALRYGTEQRRRGALYAIVDRRAVERARREGVDLSRQRGLVLVCSSVGDAVLTTYRRN